MKPSDASTTLAFHRRAAVTVEFALVLPLFLLVLFASVEFCRINVLRHAAANAAYEAARQAILPGASATDVKNAATAYMQSVVSAKGFTVNVTPDPIGDDTQEVTVTVVAPLSPSAWGVNRFGSGLSVSGSSTLRAERYRGIQAVP